MYTQTCVSTSFKRWDDIQEVVIGSCYCLYCDFMCFQLVEIGMSQKIMGIMFRTSKSLLNSTKLNHFQSFRLWMLPSSIARNHCSYCDFMFPGSSKTFVHKRRVKQNHGMLFFFSVKWLVQPLVLSVKRSKVSGGSLRMSPVPSFSNGSAG